MAIQPNLKGTVHLEIRDTVFSSCTCSIIILLRWDCVDLSRTTSNVIFVILGDGRPRWSN